MIILNYFAGPGAGKSTAAAGAFHILKKRGVNVELVTEFAKGKTWEGNYTALKDQLYITANQNYRVFRCEGKVDVVITDSPILLGLAYYNGGAYQEFEALVVKMFQTQNNINVFLNRTKKYNPSGRKEDESKARDIDLQIKGLLAEYGDHYSEGTSENAAEVGASLVMEAIPGYRIGFVRRVLRRFLNCLVDKV